MKARIILFPFAAVIEFVGLIVALLLALISNKASYFVVNLFENWPNPKWYFSGWVKEGEV